MLRLLLAGGHKFKDFALLQSHRTVCSALATLASTHPLFRILLKASKDIVIGYAPWDKGVQRKHEKAFTTQLQGGRVV